MKAESIDLPKEEEANEHNDKMAKKYASQDKYGLWIAEQASPISLEPA